MPIDAGQAMPCTHHPSVEAAAALKHGARLTDRQHTQHPMMVTRQQSLERFPGGLVD
jgi:hypothetical protein